MIAIILCGGESSRFAPLSEKNLTLFFGKSLIMWHIEQLQRIGFKKIIVVANTDNELLMGSAINGYDGVMVVVQKENGQAAAVLAAKPHFGEEAVCVLNGSDVYDDTFLRNFVTRAQKNPETVLLAAVRRKEYFPGGYLKVEGDRVLEIIEKPKPGTEPSDVVRIVADVFPTATIAGAVEKYGSSEQMGYEIAINGLIKSGVSVEYMIAPDFAWRAIKYPWDVLSVMSSFLSAIKKQTISGKTEIMDNVIVEGPVVIEDGVKIMENTKIVGPCYIGKNTIIGNNSIIRGSHIGADCVIGFNTDITRSYVGDGCWFHSNYLGDSICQKNVSMGSGAVMANLRLDDGEIMSIVKGQKLATGRTKLGAMIASGVRIGVNASIMPGVKIGRDSFIGSGVILDRDVASESFVTAKVSYVIKKNKKQAAHSRDEFKRKI